MTPVEGSPRSAPNGPRTLVACMGNALRGDDGFGVAVAGALAGRGLPPDVTLIEIGIGGLHLVQALLDGYDALVVVDAVDRDAEPGRVFVLEPDVPDVGLLAPEERHELLTDMHQAVPSRALIMAKALDALPEATWIVGCQPGDATTLSMDLSPAVRAAVPAAVARITALLAALRERTAARPGSR